MPEGKTLVDLMKFLAEVFSLDELRDLCFGIGLDWDDIPGEAKRRKCEEMVTHAKRHNYLKAFWNEVANLRAGQWPRYDGSYVPEPPPEAKKEAVQTNSIEAMLAQIQEHLTQATVLLQVVRVQYGREQ